VRLAEDLEMQDDLQDDDQRDRPLQVRQRDVPEGLDPAGVVELAPPRRCPSRCPGARPGNRIIAMPSDHQIVVMTIAAMAKLIGEPDDRRAAEASVILAIRPCGVRT
jgi:hypothetical protein